MELTNANFAQKLNQVVESIRSADFIALDTEFSGLSIGFEDQSNSFDQVEDRYQKLKHNCSRMNAFQIGIATFKWNPTLKQYVSRPFNAFVFPHSEILGNQTLQFKASNIRFLMKHNFDFNKLFSQGINYQRISDKEKVRKRIEENFSADSFGSFKDAGSAHQFNYSQNRAFTNISAESRSLLDDCIRRIKNFVQLCKQTEDLPYVEFEISSFALRKKLSWELGRVFRDQNVIFTSFSKDSTTFVVRKWKDKEDQKQRKEIKIDFKDCEEASTQNTSTAEEHVAQETISAKAEESKTEELPSREQMLEKVFEHEMGFALVIEALIASKKPLIGHNCMYDWLYVFNQFIGPLPDTFLEFAGKWHDLFPFTFDNKVLAANARCFFNTTLGTLYDVVQQNEKFKNNLSFRFDTVNDFTSYEGSALLQHYHEAAYDAHMTGVVFANVLKFKEIDSLKFQQRKDDKELSKKGGIADKKEHEKENRTAVSSLKNMEVDLNSSFTTQWINKMMLDSQGSERVYILDPQVYLKTSLNKEQKSEFTQAVHLTFEESFVSEKTAEQIANLLNDYGDFFLFKDSENSCYIEFFEINQKLVEDKSLLGFIKQVEGDGRLRILKACLHAEAKKFVSHNNFDAR